MPFAWGAQDCAQFVRHGLAAITGEDPASAWGLPDYHTQLGAARVLRRLGGLAGLPERAGLAEVAVPLAARGDVLLVPAVPKGPDRPSLALCLGLHGAATGREGLVFLPTLTALRAWRVA